MAVNEGNLNSGNSVVVGYFANGEDAQRAITELSDEGFQAHEIGAAFHSSSPGAPSTAGSTVRPSPGKEVGELIGTGTTGAGSGAKSDSGAVTPAGLASGSGTATAGASRPGPIPGSDIPHHRRESADEPLSQRTAFSETATHGQSSSLAPGIAPGTGGITDESSEPAHHSAHDGEGWWSRLKHIFGDDSGDDSPHGHEAVTKSSLNFGTGEGHLGINPTGVTPTGTSRQSASNEYSSRAFESSFSGMGIPADHSRRLAQELRGGGAVVTVRGAGRLSEAERILERNGGQVRYESNASLADYTEEDAYAEQVELFGEVRRSYRPSSASEKEDIRRAS